jgi:hypothetical protein
VALGQRALTRAGARSLSAVFDGLLASAPKPRQAVALHFRLGMPPIPFTDFANLPDAERDALGEVVSQHKGLDQIFAWGRAQSPPLHPADVIKQDEFTHDVLVPLPGDRWLVYGTT